MLLPYEAVTISIVIYIFRIKDIIFSLCCAFFYFSYYLGSSFYVLAVLHGLLYAVGGHDGPNVRKSVEFYNPSTDEWAAAAEMNFCRRNAGTILYS